MLSYFFQKLKAIRLDVGALIIMAILAIFLLRFEVALLHYPFAWELTENENVVFTQQIATHQALYRPLTTPPYLFAIYPPLFPIIAQTLIPITKSVLLANRLIALFATVTTILLVLHLLKKLPQKKLSQLTFFSLLVFFPATTFLFFGRADSVYIAASVATVFFLYLYEKALHQGKTTSVYLGLAVIASLGAVMAKQPGIILPITVLATVIYYFWRNRNKKIGRQAIVVGGIYSLSAVLILITPNFYSNVFQGANQIYGIGLSQWSYLIQLMKIYTLQFGGVLVCAFLGLRYWVVHIQRKDFEIWFAGGCWFILSLLLTLKIGLNRGASITSFLGLFYASILLVPYGLRWLTQRFNVSRATLQLVVGGVILGQLAMQLGHFQTLRNIRQPNPLDQQIAQALEKDIQKINGEILTERADTILIRADKEPQLEASSFQALTESDVLPIVKEIIINDLSNRITKKDFGAIITLGPESNLTKLLPIAGFYRKQATYPIGYIHQPDTKIAHTLWLPQ